MTNPEPPRQPPPIRTAADPTFSATDPIADPISSNAAISCVLLFRCHLQVASYHLRVAGAITMFQMTDPAPETHTSPLDAALGRVGDRWSFLLVEALLEGPRRFNDLGAAIPGIAPNILTDRLR